MRQERNLMMPSSNIKRQQQHNGSATAMLLV